MSLYDMSFMTAREAAALKRDALQTVFLTGGFAASPWLFDQLRKRLEPLGMRITRPDNHT